MMDTRSLLLRKTEIAVAFIYDKTIKGEKILGTENIFGEGNER